MATSVSTLIPRVRRFVGDYPEYDSLTASVTDSGTTLTVADSSIYAARWPIQIDTEALLVKALPSSTTVTVKRAHMGTTAASHANSSTVMLRPQFLDVEVLDALNYALGNCFPYMYKPVAQEYTGITADTYEYTLPNMTGLDVPIPFVYRVEYKESGESDFRQRRNWTVIRAATPVLKFDQSLDAGGTIRILGYGPFPRLTASGSLDTYFPQGCEDLLVVGAGEYLLASGEARRVRVDTGAIDNREQANRVGSSMQASNALLSRFERLLLRKAMPPMPRHVRPTFS